MQHQQTGLGAVGNALPHHGTGIGIFEVARLNDQRAAAVLADHVLLVVPGTAIGHPAERNDAVDVMAVCIGQRSLGNRFTRPIDPAGDRAHRRLAGSACITLPLLVDQRAGENVPHPAGRQSLKPLGKIRVESNAVDLGTDKVFHQPMPLNRAWRGTLPAAPAGAQTGSRHSRGPPA